MNRQHENLVVGIGSNHGDDQAGWRVIEQLQQDPPVAADCRKAAVPHDIIDWITNRGTLHVVDACDRVNEIRCVDLSRPHASIAPATRSGSSHQIGIDRVLTMAMVLGMLPSQVALWMIPGQSFQPCDEMSPSCMRNVEHCAALLRREVGDA